MKTQLELENIQTAINEAGPTQQKNSFGVGADSSRLMQERVEGRG
jgi:hypothetical protein